MMRGHERHRPRGTGGFTLPELLVTVAIVSLISVALGGMYLASTRAMDQGDTMAYLQRQGTLIQEELTGFLQLATVLEVDEYGAGQSLCAPEAGTSLPAGKSVLYQRTGGTAGSPTSPTSHEYWCIYEYQRPGDDYAQLWRCQVAGLTPPQVCVTAPQNLVAPFQDLAVAVSATCFRPLGLDPVTYPLATCIPATAPSPLPCAGCPASVDVSFALDVSRRGGASASPVLSGPRRFALSVLTQN